MRKLEEAIIRGCAYVRDECDTQGLWHDKDLSPEEGSDWLSGYLVKSLWFLMSVSPHELGLGPVLEKTRHALVRRQRRNGGWGYSPGRATDADTTGWILWALHDEPGLAPFCKNRGRRYLRAHLDPDSEGFRPGVPGVDDRRRREPALHPALARPQPDVTAVAVRALIADPGAQLVVRAACGYLKERQDEDGLWRSDLWAVDGCATLTALGALFVAGELDDHTVTAARSGLERLMKDAHGYELASALVTAPRLGLDHMEEAAERLLDEQDDDGAWTPPSPVRSAILTADEGAHGESSTLTGGGRPGLHRDRLLTTVMALSALQLQDSSAGSTVG